MKSIFISILIITSFISCEKNNETQTGKASYSQPSCVTYDNNSGYFYVSNRGNDKVYKLDADENLIHSFSGLSQPNGLYILNNILYVAQKTSIKGFDLTTNEEVYSVTISGSEYLNGISSDNNQTLYITDTHTHSIYKLDINSKEYQKLSESDILNPIGITYDPINNYLLIASGSVKSSIYRLKLNDNAVEEIISSNYDYFDFIVSDGHGNYFVSCWGNHSVYILNLESEPELLLFSKEHKGPSGIWFNNEDKVLVVPNFESNKLEFIKYAYFQQGPQLLDF